MNRGFAYAIFKRGGFRGLNPEKLKARQLDVLCDRFKVGNLVGTDRSSARIGPLHSANCR
jgi:hypothetical protein